MRKIIKKLFGILSLACCVPGAVLADGYDAHSVGRYGAGVAVNSAAQIPALYQGVLKNTTPALIAASAGGVIGPASSTDNAIARFDSTTGKIIQNSAATIADTTGALTIAGTTNQFVLGTTTTTTISATAPASSAVYTIPDVGTTSDFLLAAGTQTITGAKTATTTFTENRTPAADSATTNNGLAVNLTAPVDTTGTNTHNAVNVALTISNATGGTNAVNAINIGNVTGDAQDNVTGLKIGTGTTLGTSNAIQIGSGWDAGIVTDSAVQINSTNGTAITAIRFAFDAVANGQTTKTTTLTGATASSRCVASAAETATNVTAIRSVVPGTDSVVITVTADPGASNMDYTVVCYN